MSLSADSGITTPQTRQRLRPERVGASAQHQIDRVHDDGFARAGFAGHNVQPFAEFQTQFLNQRDIPHSHG